MGERLSGRRFATLVVLLFSGVLGVVQGCAGRVTEEDQAAARATVERAIRSATYESFLSAFTADNQARMRESPLWIRWWQEKFEKQRGAWRVARVEGRADHTVQVTTDHGRRPTSHQFYLLVQDGAAWRIRDIESQW